MTKLGLALTFAVVIMMHTMVTYAEGVPPDIEGAIEEEPIAEKTRWATLGIGLAAVPDYEGSEDYQGVPVPIVRVDWRSRRYVAFTGTRFRANLLSGFKKWQAGPMLNYNPGRDDVDNDRVDALRDIDNTIEGGGFVIFDAGKWETHLQFLTDVDDEHDGSLATFRQSYKRPLKNRRLLTLNFSLTYADDDYMETFFGIDTNNAARSGLRTFEAEADFKDVEVSVAFLRNVSKRWNIAYSLGYKRLLGDAADSPVVDDEGSADQFFGAIIGSYTY
ncbi:MAG: MipA/OmpV family protein [Proteobacteria bacterium]|nr:MAG: MipA/OmpV family protein [Pseudomonadota bacterium]